MTKAKEPNELTQEELERQQAEQLPDREVMSVVTPQPVVATPPDVVPIDLVHGEPPVSE